MWYIAPLRTQKLILFLLQHGTKNFTIILGGIFVGSLEGFATVKRCAMLCTIVVFNKSVKITIFSLDSEFIYFLLYDDLHHANDRRRTVEINFLTILC